MSIDRLNEEAEVDLAHSKILVVDDQAINIQTIYNILAADYTILAATSAQDALEVCKKNPPDLILLDLLMPGMTGLELCHELKQRAYTKSIPVIFVTTYNEQHEEDECWRSGGIDFITKPVNPMTIKNRVRAHLTLKYQRDLLLKMVYIDGLTSVFNRRYFDTHLEKLHNEVKRSQRDTAILMVDIDYFKLYNDNYGHVAGDDALIRVALTIQTALSRPADFVSRYGGEEFVVVLPDTDIEGAVVVAEKLLQNVASLKIVHAQSPYNRISVSIGISTFLRSENNSRSATEDADLQLYAAKESGRNKACY